MFADDLAQYDPQSTYGSIALDYDYVHKTYLNAANERALALAAARPGMDILDVACGTGAATIRLAERVVPGGRVVAVDFSPEMLALASEKASRRALLNIDWRLADATTLDLPPNSFDTVLCVMALFLMPDMPALVASLWRTVRPGGRLIVTTKGQPYLAPLYDAFYAAARDAAPHLVPPRPWQRTQTPEQLDGIFAATRVPAQVTAETSTVPLRDPDEWWRIVRATGLSRTAHLLGPEAAARVQADNRRLAIEHHIDRLTTTSLFAVAEK